MSIKLKDTIYDLINRANKDGSGNTITSTYYKTTGGTISGPVTISGGSDLNFIAGASVTNDPGDIVFKDNSGTEVGRFWKGAGENNFYVRFSSSGSGSKIWHAGNDGTSSGLDADLLDGNHASAFATSGHNHDSTYAPKSHSHSNYSTTDHTHSNYSLTSHGHTFASLSSKPTTLSGYGITDDISTIAFGGTRKEISSSTDLNNLDFGLWSSADNTTHTNGPGYQNFGLIVARLNTVYKGQLALPYSANSTHSLKYRSQTYSGSGYVWGSWRVILDSLNYETYCAKASHSHSEYLPLAGGTMKGALTMGAYDLNFKGTDPGDIAWLDGNGNETHRIWNDGGTLSYRKSAGTTYAIMHSGNYSTWAATKNHTHNYAGSSSAGGAATSALTANQLTTARTIWGQSFNGTGNVDGVLTINHNSQSDGAYGLILNRNNDGDTIGIRNTSTATNTYIRGGLSFPNRTKTNGMGWHVFPAQSLYTNGLGNTGSSYNINGCSITFGGWNDTSLSMYIDTEGKKVGIKTVNPAFPLHVNGAICTNSYIRMTASGSGTYNVGDISFNTTTGLQIEAPLKTDSSSGERYPITISWRGGFANKGGLQITGSSSATLGGYKIWHSGNDGASSGLDADTLDGNHAIAFPTAGAYDSGANFNSFCNRSYIGSLYVTSNSPTGSTTTWFNTVQIAHRNGEDDGTSYISQITIGMTGLLDRMWFRGSRTGTWREVISSYNIGSQSVNYANSAGNANTVDGYHISVGSSAGSDASTIYFIV